MEMTTAKALEIWSAQSVCDIGIFLSIVSCMLHIGRPYFERILNRLTLRVGADLWWLTYIVLRDGTLFGALIAGLFHLNLDIMADIKVGLPFVPFGTVALAAALLIKVFRNAEDINFSYRASLWLVSLGALLNTVGYVLVFEGPGDEYEAAKTAFWETMDHWRSNHNPALATVTFYIAFTLLVLLAVIAFVMAAGMYAKDAPAAKQNGPQMHTDEHK